MSSTFDGLYIARSGVRSSRANLNITGQNITNANTEGYTRQRVDQSAIPPSDYGGQWASSGATAGNGSSADATSQLRDEFLDGEYRTQNAKSGDSSVLVNTMYDMEDVFTATTTASSSSKSSVIDVLSNEFGNLVSQMESLASSKSGSSESAVREEAKLLATKLNTAAKALETERSQQTTNFSDYGVKAANDLLKNISSLDDRIKDAEVAGSSVLELKDQRNLMLDKLSKYVSIKTVETPTPVGAGRTVDTLSVYMADSDGNIMKDVGGNAYTLVSDKDYAQFSIKTETNGSTSLQLSSLSNVTPTTTEMLSIDSGSFAGYLKLLNDKGEYDSPSTATRGIGFYSSYLDSMTQKLASAMNTLNTTSGGVNKPLFMGTDSSGNDSSAISDITAKNIHISSAWSDGYLVMSTETANPSDNTNGAYSNINKMISALTNDKQAITASGTIIFNGTLQKAFASVSTLLGQDANSMQSSDDTNSSLLSNIESDRQSLSSVSLDDEAVSIVQYNQSLTASSRFMTAVDECLQNIINNMGLVGRG